MKYSGTDDFSIQEIKKIFLAGDMSKLVHRELEVNLAAKEKQMVVEETAELVLENHIKFEGSPIGFFYRNQLFAVAPAFKEPGIKPIHPSLEEKASYLRENRMDISQYMTYIAHFLASLDQCSEKEPIAYVANMPKGLNKFSPSLNKLEMFAEQHALDDIPKAQFSREDPTKKTFFLHYDRVEQPIKRFMFRRITR